MFAGAFEAAVSTFLVVFGDLDYLDFFSSFCGDFFLAGVTDLDFLVDFSAFGDLDLVALGFLETGS